MLLGLAGAIGADARVPGMVVLRAPLGRRGSYAPTVLNVAQNLGWSTFELIIISTAAAALSERVFGFRERWLWALLFGAISLVLGLMGPIGFVRRYLKKFAAWAVAASIVYLTWWVLDKADLHALWHQDGTGGVSLGQGIDLVIANIVSWTPLAADYTRFARDRRSAFFGAGVGYLLPTLWCFGIGSLLVLSRDLSEPTQIPTVVATGSALAVVALLMLTVDESDEAFADIYSTAVSLQNLLPRASQRLLIALVAATATVGAIVIDLGNYLTFLYLLGSVFVPLFAVLLADWLARGAHYSERDVFEGPRVRWPLLARLGGRLRALPVALAAGAELVDRRVEHLSPGHATADGLAAELRARLLPDAARDPGRFAPCGRSQSSGTSRSTALTAASRGSAARRSTRPARCACSAGRRSSRPRAPTPTAASLLPPLVRLGLPVLWRGGDSTAAFSFRYAGDLRSMVVDALGPPWTAADLRGLERADWVHVGALARSDFPAETLAALARDRRGCRSTARASCGRRARGRSRSTPTTTPRCCGTSRC